MNHKTDECKTEESQEELEWKPTPERVRIRSLNQVPEGDIGALISKRLSDFVSVVCQSQVDPTFHRLCGRIVLAVVAVRSKVNPSEMLFFEGINTEMSIVTGSICAERAAIIHARSRMPSVSVPDLVCIACVTVPLVNEGFDRNPIWPCGVCSEWLNKIQAKNSDFRVYAYSSFDMNNIVEKKRVLAVDEQYSPLSEKTCSSLGNGATHPQH